ncbi:hypothetical protein VP01_4125g3, partial [Puccinia sorghi]
DHRISTSMKDVVLPSGFSKLPPNFGKEKHGQLSAAQWYTLFAYVVPLVIFDLFVNEPSKLSKESNNFQFLYNTAYLVQCTHIVCSCNLSKRCIKSFKINYKHYSLSIRDLFPEAKVVPNHHFSLHIPEQLRKWGPLRDLQVSRGASYWLLTTNTHKPSNHYVLSCTPFSASEY